VLIVVIDAEVGLGFFHVGDGLGHQSPCFPRRVSGGCLRVAVSSFARLARGTAKPAAISRWPSASVASMVSPGLWAKPLPTMLVVRVICIWASKRKKGAGRERSARPPDTLGRRPSP